MARMARKSGLRRRHAGSKMNEPLPRPHQRSVWSRFALMLLYLRPHVLPSNNLCVCLFCYCSFFVDSLALDSASSCSITKHVYFPKPAFHFIRFFGFWVDATLFFFQFFNLYVSIYFPFFVDVWLLLLSCTFCWWSQIAGVFICVR